MARPVKNQLQLLSTGALYEAFQSALGDEDARKRRVADAVAEALEGRAHPWYQQPLTAVADELRELRERRAITNALLDELLARAALARSA